MTRKDILIKALGKEVGQIAIKEIIRQREESYLNQHSHDKPSFVLGTCFRWDISTQGKTYWEKIQEALYKQELK